MFVIRPIYSYLFIQLDGREYMYSYVRTAFALLVHVLRVHLLQQAACMVVVAYITDSQSASQCQAAKALIVLQLIIAYVYGYSCICHSNQMRGGGICYYILT